MTTTPSVGRPSAHVLVHSGIASASLGLSHEVSGGLPGSEARVLRAVKRISSEAEIAAVRLETAVARGFFPHFLVQDTGRVCQRGAAGSKFAPSSLGQLFVWHFK